MFTLRNTCLTAGALLVAAVVWANRIALFGISQRATTKPVSAIVFDNGTVRAPEVFVRASPAGIPIGSMRRCSSKRETLYTERECPLGYAESAVGADTRVTVLASTVAKPAAVPLAAQVTPSSRRKSLYEVLDMQKDSDLRERLMERAIGDAVPR
jgi:hypothetical protein